jgi:uncharacterized Zn-binding protein involved in type VI secretion
MVDVVKPHVGGPVAPAGLPNVLIGFLPAARVTDIAVCVGPPDMIARGSPTVLIGNLMAARLGDMTVHGGVITVGLPTVMIGDVGSGGGGGGAGGGAGAGAKKAETSEHPATGTGDAPGGPASPAAAFANAAKSGAALVCKGPCTSCGQL